METQLGTEERPITIQGTSKKIKLAVLIATLMVIAGLIMMFQDADALKASGILMAFVGLVVGGVAKFVRWWRHD